MSTMFTRLRRSVRPQTPPSPASFYSPGHNSPKFKDADLPEIEFFVPDNDFVQRQRNAHGGSLSVVADEFMQDEQVKKARPLESGSAAPEPARANLTLQIPVQPSKAASSSDRSTPINTNPGGLFPEIKLELPSAVFGDTFGSELIFLPGHRHTNSKTQNRSSRIMKKTPLPTPSSPPKERKMMDKSPSPTPIKHAGRERSGSAATTSSSSSSIMSPPPPELSHSRNRSVNTPTDPVLPQMPTRRAPPPPITVPTAHQHPARPQFDRSATVQLPLATVSELTASTNATTSRPHIEQSRSDTNLLASTSTLAALPTSIRSTEKGMDKTPEMFAPPRKPPNPLLAHLVISDSNGSEASPEKESQSLLNMREMLGSPFYLNGTTRGSMVLGGDGELGQQWNEFCKVSGLTRQDSGTLPGDGIMEKLQKKRRKKEESLRRKGSQSSLKSSPLASPMDGTPPLSETPPPVPPIPTDLSTAEIGTAVVKKVKRSKSQKSLSNVREESGSPTAPSQSRKASPHDLFAILTKNLYPPPQIPSSRSTPSSPLKRSQSDGSLRSPFRPTHFPGVDGEESVASPPVPLTSSSKYSSAGGPSSMSTDPNWGVTPPPIIPDFTTPYPHRISTIEEVESSPSQSKGSASLYSPPPPLPNSGRRNGRSMALDDLPMILSDDSSINTGGDFSSSGTVPSGFDLVSPPLMDGSQELLVWGRDGRRPYFGGGGSSAGAPSSRGSDKPITPSPLSSHRSKQSSEDAPELVFDRNPLDSHDVSPEDLSPYTPPSRAMGPKDSPSKRSFKSEKVSRPPLRGVPQSWESAPTIAPSSSSSSIGSSGTRSVSPMLMPIGLGERRPSAPNTSDRASLLLSDERRPSLPSHLLPIGNKPPAGGLEDKRNSGGKHSQSLSSRSSSSSLSTKLQITPEIKVKDTSAPTKPPRELGTIPPPIQTGLANINSNTKLSGVGVDSASGPARRRLSGRSQRKRSGSTPNPPTPTGLTGVLPASGAPVSGLTAPGLTAAGGDQYVITWGNRDSRDSSFPETPKSFSPLPSLLDRNNSVNSVRYQPYESQPFRAPIAPTPPIQGTPPNTRPPLPVGPRPRPPSRSSSMNVRPPGHSRQNSDSSVRSFKPPTPASPKFNIPPVQWRGLTLDAAKWTLTSSQLQDIVGRAIRQSAQASSIRLLPPYVLDIELPAECEQLEQLRDEIKQKYKFQVRRRRVLLRSLGLYIDGSDHTTAQRLTEELAESSATCDQLCEELYQVTEQLNQISHLSDAHASSALAMALRKLNSSLMRQTDESTMLRARIASLEAEREEAWSMAHKLEGELEGILEKLTTPTSEGHTPDTGTIKQASRVSTARKNSTRASKASLRLSSGVRRSIRSSTSSSRHPSMGFSRPPSTHSPTPPVPAIRFGALSVVTDVTASTPHSSLTSVSPTADSHALAQAQSELMAILGITPQELQSEGRIRPRSASFRSPESGASSLFSSPLVEINGHTLRLQSSSTSLRQNIKRRHSLSAMTPSDPLFKLPTTPAVLI